MRRSWKWLLAAALLVFLLFRLKFAPAPVVTYQVQKGPIVAEVLGTGTLEARVKTTISPRIQERLAEVLVDQGDFVAAGQLLARLDDGELRRLVGVADAALAGAKATAERVRVDETRAQAVELQARLDHKRVADLVTNRVSSQADFDKAVEWLHVAESDLKRTQAATVEAQRQVLTAEQNLAYQQERLTFTQILSPYAGLITRRDRDPGGVVVPGGSILQLISTNEIWVSVWVDETAVGRLAMGQPARVVFRSDAGTSYAGEIVRLGRETDRETRECLVDASVKHLPNNWSIGQRAEVYIETGRKASVLTLPSLFLAWRGGKCGVVLSERGRARWREVKLGLRGLEVVEVLEGLVAGDIVCKARDPRQALKDGQRIRVPAVKDQSPKMRATAQNP